MSNKDVFFIQLARCGTLAATGFYVHFGSNEVVQMMLLLMCAIAWGGTGYAEGYFDSESNRFR